MAQRATLIGNGESGKLSRSVVKSLPQAWPHGLATVGSVRHHVSL